MKSYSLSQNQITVRVSVVRVSWVGLVGLGSGIMLGLGLG